MRSTANGLLFSASDLVTFMGCRHATWLDIEAVRIGSKPPEVEDAQTELLQQRGLEHERTYLQELQEAGLGIETIAAEGTVDDRALATREAMLHEVRLRRAGLRCSDFVLQGLYCGWFLDDAKASAIKRGRVRCARSSARNASWESARLSSSSSATAETRSSCSSMRSFASS